MRIAVLATIAFAPLAQAFWGFGGSSKGVVTLTTSSFDSHVKKTKTLLKFYAPWCGHCKELAPKFDEAATKLDGKDVSLAKVDATVEPDLAKRFDVKGYPTLLWFADGDHTPYNGDRTAEGIVSWITAMTSPPVQEVSEMPTPGKMPAVVLRGAAATKAFNAVAKTNRMKASWYFMKDSATASPVVTVQHLEEDPQIMEGDAKDKDTIKRFFSDHAVPLFGILDGDTFAKYDGKGLVWALFPVDPAAGGVAAVAQKWRPTMTAVAKLFIGKLRVTYTDTNVYKDTIDGMLGVKEFPSIVFQPSAGSKAKFVYKGEFSREAISGFLEDALADRIEPVIKSEPVPEASDEPVQVVVASNLKEQAYRADRDFMLEVYAPWCGACKAFWPEYKKLGQYVTKWEMGEYVAIAKIDGTANDVVDESMSHDGFPALFFIAAGSQKAVRYDGERTAKAMWQWIKKNTGNADAIKATQDRVRTAKRSEEA